MEPIMTAAIGLAGAGADTAEFERTESTLQRTESTSVAEFAGSNSASVTAAEPTERGTEATAADLRYADELADALISTLKQVGAIKARAAAPVDHDITQIFLLVRLVDAGPIRATELAGLVCSDPSTVSRHVAALVKAGFIQRTSDPADGRASLLVATQAGRDHLHAQRRIRGASLAPLVTDWSEQDRTDFLRLLRRFTRELDAHRDDLLAAFQSRRTDGSN
jgi:DNA-binding MarR family transcriptional regulator